MTKHEAAVISAYTGIMVGSFSDMHKYAEKKLNRPIFTHEFADKDLYKELKEKSHDDLIKICENITENEE